MDMVNHEKVQYLARIFLTHTEIGKSKNIDVNDLTLYISHAVETGLINEDDINSIKGMMET